MISSGIFGLIGACIADLVQNRRLLFSDFINKGRSKKHHFMVIMVLFLDIFLNLLIGLTPFTDNFMHLGGFVLGVLCASTMLNVVNLFGIQLGETGFHSFRNSFVSRYFGLIISIACMVTASVFLFKGDGITSPCQSCAVLSCVSFPPWADYDNRWWYCDSCEQVKGLGLIDEMTGEFYAIELECPSGIKVTFDLVGDIDKSRDSLEKKLPMFCREECLN